MAKKKEENNLFVGISSGEDLRRSLLECSRGIIESLKDYERFKSIREEKLKMVHKLKGELKDISRLIGGLKGKLPKVKELGIKREDVKAVRVDKPRLVKVEKPRERTELERLEDELNDIESKLNGLS